jgi:tRNA-Thr(GGU) m(6)t(6)A37 methyltransferase TsaA
MTKEKKCAGEIALPFDPASVVDGTITFIGHLSTPWFREHCPKNLTDARSLGGRFEIHVDATYRQGLTGLSAGVPIVVLYWMSGARRDLVVQHPSHREVPSGTFALRSPARPNPIALAVVHLLEIDPEAGLLVIDASDAFDGTPVIDIKPWLHRIDLPPGVMPKEEDGLPQSGSRAEADTPPMCGCSGDRCHDHGAPYSDR